MNLLPVFLLALTPALAVAEDSNAGDCILGAINNGGGAGSESNFAKIKGMGELAFVAKDPTKAEALFTCIVLNLKTDNTYELRYQDEDGVTKSVNGTYEDKRETVPLLNYQDAFMSLKNLPSGVFNNGNLLPVVFIENELVFQTCRFSVFPASSRTTYLAVPLQKAIDNAANQFCACGDWSSA